MKRWKNYPAARKKIFINYMFYFHSTDVTNTIIKRNFEKEMVYLILYFQVSQSILEQSPGKNIKD